MKSLLALVFVFLINNCFSQISKFYVEPKQTDNNYITVQDSHLVVRNTTLNNNKLFLFLGGTGSNTKNYNRISEFTGKLGYDMINLSYINTVAAASLKNSSDNLAFDKYRQEICYGSPLSPAVTVDSLNSINTRTVKLIKYLHFNYPTQSWDQYLIDQTTLDWSKIIIAGHSQGGGHACYLAKLNNVNRVLMFSSPNDYSDHFSRPANWLNKPGLTSINNHFAYLSLLDEVVDFSKQLSNIEYLGLYPLFDTSYVDNLSAPYNNSHCLYTTQKPGLTILNHNSTLKFSSINNEVWEYMLSSKIGVTNISRNNTNTMVLVYPNPTPSEVSIHFKRNIDHKNFIFKILMGKQF